ncbi:MAG: TIGR04255 family protein [Desulfovermiculus sp.]|nr:TIGR04255 family protein [Desulfovermiculus sp.]
MKIPKRIDPCPIVEALYEIRFEPNYPSDAIFGLIYKAMKQEFDSFEKLPILELPETIRSTDDVLEYKPYLSTGQFFVT